MAPRYYAPQSPYAAYIKRRAETAKAANPDLTYRQIARAFGMDERTLRKYRAGQGEASGRRKFREARKPPPGATSAMLYTIHYQWWKLASPHWRMWASVNAVIRHATIFDVFALKSDPRIIDAVRRDLAGKMRRRGDHYQVEIDDADFEIDSIERVRTQRMAGFVFTTRDVSA